ncbi:MAG TPA: hypothetical protein QGH92_01125 [Candidatus Parcubacteria bacterium]|jgi:hypothetical protein|nr:hypothetical protein [Candidatus Parcubacteria bacterium]
MDSYNLVILSGWIAAFFLALNFLTCLVAPWSKTKCLWQGKYPGPDKCDHEGFKPIAYMHRIFVLLSVIAIVIHLILAISHS